MDKGRKEVETYFTSKCVCVVVINSIAHSVLYVLGRTMNENDSASETNIGRRNWRARKKIPPKKMRAKGRPFC